MRLFWTFLVVAFVVASALADKSATTHLAITGTVAEFRAGRLISVRNEQTDPGGFRVALNDTTTFEASDGTPLSPVALAPGARVTMWYRSIAGNGRMADKLRLLGGQMVR